MITPKISSILIIASLHLASCMEREMTVQVNPKERECFYENLGKNKIEIVSWQSELGCFNLMSQSRQYNLIFNIRLWNFHYRSTKPHH